MEKIKIRNKLIGKGEPCFIIAEAGVNHNGKISLAYKLVDAAKKAGADAVKFQTFVVDEGTPKSLDKVDYQKQNSPRKESMYKMLKRLEFGLEEFAKIKSYCNGKNIMFLSTPCDFKSVKILDKIGVNAFKIGSGDLTFIPLIREIAKKKKPIILSTGMATPGEVEETVKTILPINKKLILLHCTTNYPCPLEEVNLKAMLTLRKEFGLQVGYSDHTLGIMVPAIAVALGARVIEKHFTLDKNLPGPDHKASLEPKELGAMTKMIRSIEQVLGSGIKKPTKSELKIAKKARKSIVAVKNLKKGEILSKSNIKIMKPEKGLKPKYWNQTLGKRIKRKKSAYEGIFWEDLI